MPKSLSDISELKLKRMYDLVFSDTDKKGGYRVRKGAGFAYYDNKDQLIKCHKVKSRIKAIAVPPSYEDVWYCPNDNGHIQAVGKDSTGKKQYFYHDTWAEAANALKFESMQDFAFMLPRMRHKLRKALKNRAADKQTVIATMVKILDNTGMRIGHPRSAGNKTYGLANLMDRHVEIDDDIVHFEYTGKSNIHLEKSIQDSRVIDVLENSLELDSRKVFSYVDGHGDTCAVSATDVNVFIKSVMGQGFFRKRFQNVAFHCSFFKRSHAPNHP